MSSAPSYRASMRWENKGVFDILLAILLTNCDELQGVNWHWQAVDDCLSKARGVPESGLEKGGPDQYMDANSCDHDKSGVKKSVLIEGNGWPLAVCISGAETMLFALTLDAVAVERPQPTAEKPQHLCLDKGYDNLSGEAAYA